MTDTLKRFLGVSTVLPQRELVVVSPPPPSAQELLAGAQTNHEEAERAAQTSVEKGIAAGKKLLAAKKQTPHGFFEEAITTHCKFAMGTAQKYMRLARREPQLLELIGRKRSAGLHLSMRDALKFLNKLTADEKPKTIKRKPT
mgnify:CR=1 FL=1